MKCERRFRVSAGHSLACRCRRARGILLGAGRSGLVFALLFSLGCLKVSPFTKPPERLVYVFLVFFLSFALPAAQRLSFSLVRASGFCFSVFRYVAAAEPEPEPEPAAAEAPAAAPVGLSPEEEIAALKQKLQEQEIALLKQKLKEAESKLG